MTAIKNAVNPCAVSLSQRLTVPLMTELSHLWCRHSYPSSPPIDPPADSLVQVEREQIHPALTRERAGKTRCPQNPINLEIAGDRCNLHALFPEHRLSPPHVQRRGNQNHLLPPFHAFHLTELNGLVMSVG